MDGGPTRAAGPLRVRRARRESPAREHISRGSAEGTMDELIRSHAPKRERDFDAAPPAKQRATTNDLSLDRTLDELFAEGGARSRASCGGRRRTPPLAQRGEAGRVRQEHERHELRARRTEARVEGLPGAPAHAGHHAGGEQAQIRRHRAGVAAQAARVGRARAHRAAPAAAADGDAVAAAAADADDAFDDYLESALGQFGSTGTLPPPARAAAPAPRRSPRAVAAAAAAPPPPAASPTAPPREPTMRERLDA